jgi:hypothetical protein
MRGTTNGFTMEEYAEYTALIELHKHYSSMMINDLFEEINFEKAIDDTLRRWQFITSWTSRDFSRNVSVLKNRIESKKIVKLMKFDEPLCFEDMVCLKPAPRCGNCPLWHINGYSCEDSKSLKAQVMKPWAKGAGYFYPHMFAAIIRKLKYGQAIYSYDYEMFLGVR